VNYKGFRIDIHQDEEGCSVSDALESGAATLYAWHRRYKLGEAPPWADEARDEGKLAEAIVEHNPGAVVLPVYMLDHSGLRFSTTPFGCRWDSGQVGVIFTMEPESEGGGERLLRAIVEEMDQRASGNVWGYVVTTPEGEQLDSCWGFVGNEDDGYMLDEARSAVDHEIARRASGEQLVAEAFAL
jgi:hypothetical protein